MTNGFASILLIITLLFSQASGAYSVSQSPCEQMQEMMTSVEQVVSLEHQVLMQGMNTDANDTSCCLQDCNCPAGLLSIAVLLDTSMKSDPNFRTPTPSSIDNSFQTIVLQKLQRPPKRISFS